MLTIQLVFFGATYGLSAYGFSLETDSNLLESHTELLPFLLVLAGVLLMGGLTGIFILTWRPYAYNFGIVYCTSAFAAILYGEITNMPSSNGDGALQYLLLICFIIHLIRHRRSWRRTVANKAAHTNPLPVPSRNLNAHSNP